MRKYWILILFAMIFLRHSKHYILKVNSGYDC